MMHELSAVDEGHLLRCVQLATQALNAGDDPFGSVLVDEAGTVLAEAVNRETTDCDPTAHPELDLARWAIAHMTPQRRATSTVYTSGEHCPMCAAAHGWVGLGKVVAAASSATRRVARFLGASGRTSGTDSARRHRARRRSDHPGAPVRRDDARTALAGTAAGMLTQ